MDGFAEAPGESLVTDTEAAGHESFKMLQCSPKKSLHHIAVACLIGMGEGVAGRSNGSAHAAEPTGVDAQGIADVVETDGVGELGEEQAHDMTPWGEGAGLPINAILSGEFWHQVSRDELAKLG